MRINDLFCLPPLHIIFWQHELYAFSCTSTVCKMHWSFMANLTVFKHFCDVFSNKHLRGSKILVMCRYFLRKVFPLNGHFLKCILCLSARSPFWFAMKTDRYLGKIQSTLDLFILTKLLAHNAISAGCQQPELSSSSVPCYSEAVGIPCPRQELSS